MIHVTVDLPYHLYRLLKVEINHAKHTVNMIANAECKQENMNREIYQGYESNKLWIWCLVISHKFTFSHVYNT